MTDPTPPLLGWWHNELGSEMQILNFNPVTHEIIGQYKTKTGSTPSACYPLKGTANGDIVSFTVNWGLPITAGGEVYDSITAWVGQFVHWPTPTDPEVLRTFWILQSNSPDEETPGTTWDDLRMGSDVFSPGPA